MLPLSHAIANQFEEGVKILLEHGADIDKPVFLFFFSLFLKFIYCC